MTNQGEVKAKSDWLETHRHLVMPVDLNSGYNLFGGQMGKLLDHAAALYAMCQLNNKSIVTAQSTITFKVPVKCGDFLKFYARKSKIGTSSLTVQITVRVKPIGETEPLDKLFEPLMEQDVAFAELVFVNLGANGKPKPHGLVVE